MAAEKWSPSTRAPGVGGLDFEICWSRAAAQKQATIDPVMQPEPAESENCIVCQTLRKVYRRSRANKRTDDTKLFQSRGGSQQGVVRGQIFEAQRQTYSCPFDRLTVRLPSLIQSTSPVMTTTQPVRKHPVSLSSSERRRSERRLTLFDRQRLDDRYRVLKPSSRVNTSRGDLSRSCQSANLSCVTLDDGRLPGVEEP